MRLARRTTRELTADGLALGAVVGALALWWNVHALAARGAAIDLSPDDVFLGVVGVGVVASCIGAGRVLLRLARLARRRRHMARDGESGTLSIEFLLTFPWVYIMFGLVIQFLLIGRAKIVSDFAAWRAARSAIVQIEEDNFGGLLYDFMFDEEIPDQRMHRPREAAALILAQLSPLPDSTLSGWRAEPGMGGVSPAASFADTGVRDAPWGYTTERFEAKAGWALAALRADTQGSRIEVDMGRPEMFNFDANQYTSAFQESFDDILSNIGGLDNMLNGIFSPDQQNDDDMCWIEPDFGIPPWEEVCAGQSSDNSIIDTFLGMVGLDLDSALDQIRNMVVNPFMSIVRPLFDIMQSAFDAVNFSNPFAPRQVTVVVEYPYQLKMPLVATLMQPNRVQRHGVFGRFITLRSEVSLQSTGTRVGNVTCLISGSPIP